METVKDWLCKNGLGEYCIEFEENGWDEMSLLPEMTYADIEMCIKKRGHIVKFKKAVEQYVMSSGIAKEMPTIIYRRATDSSTQVKAQDCFDNYEFPQTSPTAELETYRLDCAPGAFTDTSIDGDNIATPRQSLHLNVDEEEFQTNISTEETAVAVPTKMIGNHGSDTSDSENDANHPIALISNLNTPAVFDPEVSSQPTVNLTYIKHSEHTNVSTEPAQIITDPSMSTSLTDNLNDNDHERIQSDSTSCSQNQDGSQMESIASWHADGDKQYIETNAIREVQEVLEDNHWVTILGKPGEGKTAMATRLMLKYKEKGYEPVFLSSALDWKLLISGGKSKQFVVIDDMFGTTCLDRNKVNEWLSCLENMGKLVEVQNGNILVVCTNRQYIFDDITSKLEKINSFRADQIVNLSSKMYRLTPKEKLEIFNAYADKYGLKAAEEDEIKTLDPPHGFPHCVVMYHTNAYLRQEGMSFFENPSECVRRDIYNFKENDRFKFLALLIVLLSKNQLKIEELNQWLYDNTDSQRRLIQALGIPQRKLVDIRKNFTLLEGSYIERGPDDYYCFTHESLMENVAYVFASANPHLAMDILDLKCIITFFRQLEAEDSRQVKGECPRAGQKHVLRLNFHQKVCIMKSLAKRLTKEVKIGNTLNASLCSAWRNQGFLKEWISYILTEPDEEFQLMLSSQANIRDNLLISLTQFSMDDAVSSILRNKNILNKMKKCVGWTAVLQSGLELSSLEKDSNVLEAFADAAHSKDPPCRLQGSQLLLDVLQNGSGKNAMALIRKTEIEPYYTDHNARGYVHHLVKAKITEELFERLLDLLSDMGTDINSKDFIGVSPLDICLNMFNSADTKEELDMAFDRGFYLLRKGATCSVVQKEFCERLLEKLGSTNFDKSIVELQRCLFIPMARQVAEFLFWLYFSCFFLF